MDSVSLTPWKPRMIMEAGKLIWMSMKCLLPMLPRERLVRVSFISRLSTTLEMIKMMRIKKNLFCRNIVDHLIRKIK